MPNEFIVFLVGGLAILALMLVLFGGPFSTETVEIGVVGKEISANLSGAALVGSENVDSLKPYYTDINTSYTKGAVVHEVDDKELFSGLLFGSNNIEYLLDEAGAESLTIKFDVVETNGYAPLIIKVNDNLVKEKTYVLGEYEIVVDKSLIQDTILVSIQAGSSGWKIWAPTVYKLSDIELVVKSYSQQNNEFVFTISDDEYDMFRKGRIDLTLDDNIGSFVAELNNKVIYSGIVEDYESLEFNQSSIKKGENVLELRAGMNSLFTGEANLLIFYKSRRQNTIQQEFNLTEGEYKTMKRGRISFEVVSVIEDGGMSIKIESDGEELYSQYATVGEGRYNFDFESDDVEIGTNTMSIESIDDALFAIKDLEIVY